MIGTFVSSVAARSSVKNLLRRRPLSCLPNSFRSAGGCQHERFFGSQHVLGLTSSMESQNRFISTTTPANASAVFSGWTPLDWHKDTFMSNASVREKEAWLDSMLKTDERSVDIEAFMIVLRALSESRDAGAPIRAEKWMSRLLEHPHVEPTVSAYQAVIQAWANADKEKPIVVVNRAEKWLNDLVGASQKNPDDESLKPTIELYNAYLDACTRGRPGNNKHDTTIIMANAIKADALLRRLHSEYYHQEGSPRLSPNTESFNYVIRGWTRCQQGMVVLNRILGLLRLMEAYQRSDPVNAVVRPDSKSYSMAMDALARRARMKARACIMEGGYSKDATKNGVAEMNEAEALLKYMHELYDAGVEGVVPGRVAYNLLIGGWAGLAEAKHFNAPFQAEAIFRRMLAHQDNGFNEAAPDRVSYEKVMLAWANSRNQNAGKRAQWWMQQLWNASELQGNKDLLPTKFTYNIVIKALAFSEGALAAENLLLDMGDRYRKEMSHSLCPNSESFAIVIQAWLRQVHQERSIEGQIGALQRAVEWLSSLREIEKDNNLSTTPEQYHRVLEAAKTCARERPEVLDLAKTIFHDQQQSRHGIDVFSYSRLLDVGLEALSSAENTEERNNFVQSLFQSCCEDGMLGKYFVRALVNYDGWTLEEREEMQQRLFHTWPFPPSWTRNVKSTFHVVEEHDFARYIDSSSRRH